MAGPNPYRRYSFRELRKGLGASWLVCTPCRRYTPLVGGDDRDTRFTTFSCAVCGGPGEHVFDDPHKAGLQPDLRARPLHHPDAALRLRTFAAAAREEEEHRLSAEREATWRRAQRPKPEARPAFTLKPFPCRTFGDLATWGIAGSIDCGSCHHRKPLEVTPAHKALSLLRTRLRCSALRPATAASPARPCTGRGQLWLNAHGGGGVPAEAFVSVVCSAFDHTMLSVSYILIEKPPWRDYLAKGEHFGCPECRRRMAHTWQNVGSGGR